MTLIVGLVSGLGTWLVAPEGTIHIGASGIVFGYATYLLARGVFNRNVWEILIGVAVAAVWGTALLGGLMPQEGVSWQGHFFGAVGGVLAALAAGPAARAARSIRPMEVTVRLFAMLRERAGAQEVTLELPDGARVRDALDSLSDLAEDIPLVLAVNREYADSSRCWTPVTSWR